MTLEFQEYALLVQRMRAIAGDNGEPQQVREAARDIVLVLERDRTQVFQRLLTIATDSARSAVDRVRAMEVLLTLI